MPITTTDTGLKLTGPYNPVSLIVINNDAGLQTLNMGLLTDGLQDIDSGTDYTLGFENVFNGHDVFVFLSAELEDFFVTPIEFNSPDKRLIWLTPKDPADIERFAVDYATWLIGDDVTNATFTAPQGSELVIEDIVLNNNIASAMISSGVVGTHYIDVTLTTDSGRVRQRSVKLRVKQV